MALIDEIQRVKIGDQELLVSSIKTVGGQRTTIHEYVNSNKSDVEDLGQSLEEFTLRCIVSGDNYRSRVAALQRELSGGGEKTFIHKTLGTFNVKVIGKYILEENETEFGFARFTFSLKRITPEKKPTFAQPTEQTIAADVVEVEQTTAAMIEGQFTVPKSVASIQGVADKLLAFTTRMNSEAAKYTKFTDKITKFSKTINLIKGNVYSIIQSPVAVSRSIQDVFNSFDALFQTPEDAIQAYNGLFTFGIDDQPTNNNTLDYIARQQDFNVVNNTININALARSYSAASQIEFNTVISLENTQNQLDTQYGYVLDSLDMQADQSKKLTKASGKTIRSVSSESVIIGGVNLESAASGVVYTDVSDLIVVIDNLRNDARLFFNDKRLTTPQILTENTPIAPAAVISYWLYGTTAFASDLLELNGTNDTLVFGGNNLKVYSG